MQKIDTLTRLVCQVAREAGAYIRKERASFSVEKVERKHAHDYVSYVDKGSEQLIVSALRKLVPEAGFITEEGTTVNEELRMKSEEFLSGESVARNAAAQPSFYWVIDPLDGTTNFIHGYAPYAVSIALLKGKEILLGVVYEIVSDECYYAWKGGKAWVDVRRQKDDGGWMTDDVTSEQLHVGNSSIDDALLCLQLPYNSDAYKPVIKRLIDRYYGHVGSIRMIGSAAMALCYVAAGRLDGYAERYISQWDYMAGALIVQEAGGTVTDYSGSGDFTRGDSVVATNGIIHQALLDGTKESL